MGSWFSLEKPAQVCGACLLQRCLWAGSRLQLFGWWSQQRAWGQRHSLSEAQGYLSVHRVESSLRTTERTHTGPHRNLSNGARREGQAQKHAGGLLLMSSQTESTGSEIQGMTLGTDRSRSPCKIGEEATQTARTNLPGTSTPLSAMTGADHPPPPQTRAR